MKNYTIQNKVYEKNILTFVDTAETYTYLNLPMDICNNQTKIDFKEWMRQGLELFGQVEKFLSVKVSTRDKNKILKSWYALTLDPQLA